MKQYTWKAYYKNFMDWDEKECADNLPFITELGPVDQVSNVLLDLVNYKEAVDWLLQKTIEEDLPLKNIDLGELADYCSKRLLYEAVKISSLADTDDVMEGLMALSETPKAVKILMQRAIDAGLSFKVSDLMELYDCCESKLLAEAVELSTLDTRDSETVTDWLCMIEEEQILLNALQNKVRSSGFKLRTSDMIELYEATDRELSKEILTASTFSDADAEEIMNILYRIGNDAEAVHKVLQYANENNLQLDTIELLEIWSNVEKEADQNLFFHALELSDIGAADAGCIETMLDDFCDQSSVLNEILKKVISKKKRLHCSALINLPGTCADEFLLRTIELAEIDDQDAFMSIVTDFELEEQIVNRLIKVCIKEKVCLSGQNLVHLYGGCNEGLLVSMIMETVDQLTMEDVNAMAQCFDDNLIIKICNARNFPLPKGVMDVAAMKAELDAIERREKMYRRGVAARYFFAGLFNLNPATLKSGPNRRERRKRAHGCSGDCANCPPHYGYRYGRWYYGRCHHHGCEFGGNIGNGKYD